MSERLPFTAQQKADAAVREVKYRKRVFDRRVAEGKMTFAKAAYETDIMQAIADDYEKLAASERLI